MKNSSLLKLIAFLLILAGTFAFCQKPPEPINDPIEISFTELKTECQWTNLDYDKVIIINSNAELGQYISCTGGSSYPAIDFSTHTLLLVGGKANLGICRSTATGLQQLSSGKYKLNVEIALNDAADVEEWAIALIVKKLKGENNVDLKLIPEVIETKTILPIVVTDQKTIAFFNQCLFTNRPTNTPSSCFFTTLGRDKDTCIMINTMEEFRHTYECTDDLPEIDFDSYTLIIGKKKVNHTGYSVLSWKILSNCSLTLYLELSGQNSGGGTLLIHHWGIYPKLPDRPFYVKYE